MKYAFYIVLLLFASCSYVSTIETTVSFNNVGFDEREIAFSEVVSVRVPSEEIIFFGVRLGDQLEDVIALHGTYDVKSTFDEGRIVNIEYDFFANSTSVLYHTEDGVVRAVLVTQHADLQEQNMLGMSTRDVYAQLGLPTRTDDVFGGRLFVYDAYGYEIYFERGFVNRIYFTFSQRGISPAGEESIRECSQEILLLRAPDTGECYSISSCIIPDGWTICEDENTTAQGSEAEHSEPSVINTSVQQTELCVLGTIFAITQEGDCQEYTNSCDVPINSSVVRSC